MPGHTSSACQKLNSRAENSPTSEMVKRAHVSTSGSSDEAAAVNPVISQPPGDPIETVRGGGGRAKLLHETSSQHGLANNATTCQKLNTGVEDSPTSRMVKRAHVSPSGSSDEAAIVNPVINQPSGDPCPNAERAVTGSQEVVRKGAKAKLFP